MRDLSSRQLTVNGTPIASLAEMQELAYAVPEDRVLPGAFARFIAGQDLSPAELYEACESARDATGDSDAALEVLETLKARLRDAFRAEID